MLSVFPFPAREQHLRSHQQKKQKAKQTTPRERNRIQIGACAHLVDAGGACLLLERRDLHLAQLCIPCHPLVRSEARSLGVLVLLTTVLTPKFGQSNPFQSPPKTPINFSRSSFVPHRRPEACPCLRKTFHSSGSSLSNKLNTKGYREVIFLCTV